jgi:Carboxypeptidase regulatory-like domain
MSHHSIACSTRCILALAVLLLIVAPLHAQSLFGTISGTVVDEQGGALPGADVTLTDQTSKGVQRTTTNGEGVFVFAAVSAGTYSV